MLVNKLLKKYENETKTIKTAQFSLIQLNRETKTKLQKYFSYAFRTERLILNPQVHFLKISINLYFKIA